MMGKRRRQGNYTPQKNNNSTENLVGNEENGYPGPDPKKTMIDVSKELSDSHKKSIKEDIMEETTEILTEKLCNMVNQKIQDALKKYQDIINKNLEKTQKQLNEFREDLNKHQSETKETVNKEIHEIKETT
jgi:hypothetical protein